MLLNREDQGRQTIVNEKALCIGEYCYRILDIPQVSTQEVYD